MATELHVRGLADLQKFLDQLAPKIEANVMRGALRAGMNVVKPVAQANIHSVSGELARGLRVSTGGQRGVVKAFLRSKGSHGYIARWVEFGTKAHFISVAESEKPINKRLSAKRRKLVKVSMTTINRNALKIGANFVGPTVHHPGAKPHPFLRPALDSEAQRAVVAAGKYIQTRLQTKEGMNTADIVIEGEE